ncbi:MAG: DUF2007 domain-containing protein [Woeseiaceae bacterium]|nr:DUF2007 domain-containing protein [Woeseiaceae bacterium]
MKKVFTSPESILVHHYKNLLESEGIRAVVRNEILDSVMGRVPFQETWPEVWVVNDLDYDRAKQLIEGVPDESPSRSWRCRTCGETNEGQFAVCWQCGTGYA